MATRFLGRTALYALLSCYFTLLGRSSILATGRDQSVKSHDPQPMSRASASGSSLPHPGYRNVAYYVVSDNFNFEILTHI